MDSSVCLHSWGAGQREVFKTRGRWGGLQHVLELPLRARVRPCWGEASLGLRLAEGSQLRPWMAGPGNGEGASTRKRGRTVGQVGGVRSWKALGSRCLLLWQEQQGWPAGMAIAQDSPCRSLPVPLQGGWGVWGHLGSQAEGRKHRQCLLGGVRPGPGAVRTGCPAGPWGRAPGGWPEPGPTHPRGPWGPDSLDPASPAPLTVAQAFPWSRSKPRS